MWSMPKLDAPRSSVERIAFCGPMAAGKTFLANHLVNQYGYHKYSFATKLKALCYELYGIDKKDGESRQILQRVGQQLRVHDPDVWVKYTLTEMRLNSNPLMVIDDLRYKNEADALRDNGFYIITVNTSEEIRRTRVHDLYPDTDFDTASMHGSEKEWKWFDPNFVISSDTWDAILNLEELIDNAKDSLNRKAPTGKYTGSEAFST